MSFLESVILINKSQTNKKPHNHNITFRKEGRPVSLRNKQSFHHYIEKTSVSASSGSLTIEAAFGIPLFIFAAVCLIWLLEIQVIHLSVEAGMQEAGKRLAQEMAITPAFSAGRIEKEIVKSIGEERLDRSLVDGGSRGLHCEKSILHRGSEIMDMKVSYKIRIPIPVFAVPVVEKKEEMRIKCWTGYAKEGFFDDDDNTLVFVTETGLVYHKKRDCPYLDLSVKAVSADRVKDMRNQSKGKYYPCEHCMKKGKAGKTVYVTEYGDRYHSSLTCSGLKRTIYAVPISEVQGKGACSKCGK